MLLKHAFAYALARGLPGLSAFAALAVYTRLLAPDQFGRYALLIAGVGLANAIIFQWLRLVAARFLQNHASPDEFLGCILAQFYMLAACVGGAGIVLSLAWPDPVWQRLLALAVPLLVTQAGLELSLVISSARLEPRGYGLMLSSKAVIAVVLGGWLAWLGLGAAGPVWGLIAGQTIALLVSYRCIWGAAQMQWPADDELRRYLRYGLPLIATFALAWVISASDRLLLMLLLNEEAVGYYSPGYDLAFQSLTLVLTVINTAAYPLAVKALASGGPETARRQLQENGELVATAALVGCATLIVLAPSIVLLLIGEAFRPTSLALLPIVAIAAALAGIKAYHFDTAFHLGEQSHVLVYISSLAAIVNIGLNLVLIPKLGVLGAAWGTLGAYACALILSVIAARRAFPMPATGPLLAKSATTALFVSLAISCPAMVAAPVIYRLPVGLVLGLLAFVIAVIVFDISDARRVTCVIIRRFQVRFNNVRSGK
jgi:O-antigen/teichoic acid export membrane protein